MTYSTTPTPEEPKPTVIVKEPIDLFGPMLVVWIILCAGTPDLLDAIIHYVMTR